MNIGGTNYTNFRAVRLKGDQQGLSGATGGRIILSDASATGYEGTLSVGATESARAWTFPDKSGTFPIMGSFVVQLPAIAATTSIQSTIVTVTGVRVNDALSVTMNGGVTAGYGDVNTITSGATSRILHSAYPGAGTIQLNFFNLGVATGYVEFVGSYLAMRK